MVMPLAWRAEQGRDYAAPPPLCARRPLPDDGLQELEGLLLAERLQGDLAERQVASQVGQLRGKLRVEFQPFTA